MSDEPEAPEEEAEEAASVELFLGDGEVWFADIPALLEAFPDVIGFANDEGCTVAFVKGRGVVKMGDLLSKPPSRSGAKLTVLKGKKDDAA